MDKDICKLINSHLQDNVSKEIFANRIMYDITGDELYLKNVIKTSRIFEKIKELLECSKEEKIIYGMGDVAKIFFSLYAPSVKFKYAIDSYKYGYSYEGLQVKDVKDFLRNYSDELIIICAWDSHAVMKNCLIKEGIPSDKVVDIREEIGKFGREWQYFDLKELKVVEDEVFVDGGCYDGANSIRFIKWCNQRYKKIYAYEPEIDNFHKCKRNLSHFAQGKVGVYRKGLWNENAVLHFEMGNGTSGRLDESAESSIETIRIDNSVDDKITFIKLDIEGAEYQALKGAENQIRNNKPKLAVCVYHKPEDVIEISRLILEMNPGYRLYLRHYSLYEWETVLYAIDEKEIN